MGRDSVTLVLTGVQTERGNVIAAEKSVAGNGRGFRVNKLIASGQSNTVTGMLLFIESA